MRSYLPYLIIAAIGVATFSLAFRASRLVRNESASETAYFQQIRPIEDELEDVRGNLRNVVSGRKPREPLARVVSDAREESQQLHSMPDIPAECRNVHQQLVSWSTCLNSAATDAGRNLPSTTKKQLLKTSLARADDIYWKAEIGAASNEH